MAQGREFYPASDTRLSCLRENRATDKQIVDGINTGFAAAYDYVQIENEEGRHNNYKSPKLLKTALLTLSFAAFAYLTWTFEIQPRIPVFAAGNPTYQPHTTEVATAEYTPTAIGTPDFKDIPTEFFRRDPGISDLFYSFPIGVRFGGQIVEWVKPYPHVTPNLLATIGLVETCGNPNAHRYDGGHDKGTFSINDTAWPNVDYFDTSANATKALQILEEYMAAYDGNPDAVGITAAAYNGGPPGAKWASKQISWNKFVSEVGVKTANSIKRYKDLVTGIYTEAQEGASFSQTAYNVTAGGGFYSAHSMCNAAAADTGWPWPFPDDWSQAGKK